MLSPPLRLAPASLMACLAAKLCLAGSLTLGGALAGAASLSVLVLDKDGKPTPDAVVVVMPRAAPAAGARTPLAPVSIAQEEMRFVPAVAVVGTGTTVRFVNNDSWDHHVRGTAAGLAQFNSSGGFEFRLDGKPEGKPASSASVTLDKPGAVQLGCHLHSSMRGYIYVSDSPWAIKTGADGVALLPDLPDGAAQLKVWHADQLIDLPTQEVSLSASPAKVTVQLSVVPRRRRI